MTQAQSEGVGLAILNRRAALADACVSYHFNRCPELRQRYGQAGVEKCTQDADYHLSFLAEAITSAAPALFERYVQWARSMLAARNIAGSDLVESLEALRAVLAQEMPLESAKVAAEYIDHALNHIEEGVQEPPYLLGDEPLKALGRDYLGMLLRGERRNAASLILEAAARGTPVADIHLRVIQPVLYEIGRLWQTNEISVAQEHYCAAATQLIMSQLYPMIFTADRRGRTLVAACVSGDLHEIGLRMVADFFELSGWDTYYLGANVPIRDLLRLLADLHADVLALSATMGFNVGAVRETIRQVQGAEEGKNVVILAGGYSFNMVSELWRLVGADGCASDAAGALAMAEELLDSRSAQ